MLIAILVLGCVTTQAFILQEDNSTGTTPCVQSYPCTCLYPMKCDHEDLTEIPPFIQGRNDTIDNFDLSFNNITSIPDAAFTNISALRGLDLNHNQIDYIADDAFAGVEDTLYRLYLSYNNLHFLPDAFLKLHQLAVLELEGNPISSLSPSHMASFGRYLSSFTISLGLFTSWPTQLHYLMRLRKLRVVDIPFSQLPLDAFNGFEHTLITLEIINSDFNRIPSAVCHMDFLANLVYDDNVNSDHPLMEPCRTPLKRVSFIELKGNNFSKFPNVFHTFTDLTTLTVSNDPNLLFVDSGTTNDTVDNITNLDVSGNGFERIPSVLQIYTNLESLNISYNSIKTLEYGDLSSFQNLIALYLQGNPLLYIDSHAFSTLEGMLPIQTLNLDDTKLRRVPEAAAGLPALKSFHMRGNPLECSCSMRYIKHWRNITTHLYGQCEFSSESLSTYVSGDLQAC